MTSAPRGWAAPSGRRVLALLLTAAVVMLPAACRGGTEGTGGGSPATPLPTPTSTGDGGPTGGPSSGPAGTDGTVSLGAKWDWGRYTEFTPYLRTLSGGRTYYEVVWCDVEPKKGAPDWSSLDRIAERSRSLGIDLMLKLRVGLCWATGGQAQYERGSKGKTESAMPQDMAAYRNWVHTVVARYSPKGVSEYAIENEINSKSFWAGTPEQYRTLVETASAQIRSANPRAKVVDAGLSSTTYGYGIADRLLREGREAEAVAAYNRYYARRFGTRGDKITEVHDRASLQAALASEQGARNLAYLGLMSDLASRHVVDVRQVHFYESWAAVRDLFAYLRATTSHEVPVEAWEVGRFDRDSGTDGTESEEMVRTVSLMLAEGARVVVWLPLAFDPGGRNPNEPRFGLLEPDGSVRPAGRLFQQLASAARGATTVPVADGDLTGVALQRAGRTTAVVWSPRPRTLQLGKGDSAGPLDGSTTSTGRVTVGQQPVRLALNGSVKDLLEAQ